jgi:hypothetical protein
LPFLQVQTWPRQWIFKGDKNPQHAVAQSGSKAIGTKLLDFMACKSHFEI